MLEADLAERPQTSDEAAAPVPKPAPKYPNLAPAWQPGQSGNPTGRAKGSRNRLGEQFTDDLLADWEEHGPEVIVRVREDDPSTYLRVVAGILPKEIRVTDATDLSDADLDQRIRTLAAVLGQYLSGEEGTAGPVDGEGKAGLTIESVALPPVSETG